MIRADKSGPLGWLMRTYVTRKFRAAFRGLWVRGSIPAEPASRLVYANHCSWWDGFVAHQLFLRLGWDGYALMEERNLARYRVLARVGAFSIRQHEGLSSLTSLRYARELLSRPRAAVVVFPEGVMRPFDSHPLLLERGVSVLARVSRARCLPIAIRYAFFEHERPDVLVEVGEEHAPAPQERFERGLGEALARLTAVRSLEGFTQLISGGAGVAQTWDAVRGRR